MVKWKRSHEIFGEGKFKVFDDRIEPNDIKQGVLSNCWLMCAVSCLAEFPSYIKRLFVTSEVQEHGLYRVKICKHGVWQTVTVDDYFPCDADTGELLFSRASGNEIWVLLLEKAYAKLHGSYYSLIGGETSEGLIDLSGCPTKTLDLVNDKFVKEQMRTGELFKLMKEYDLKNYL